MIERLDARARDACMQLARRVGWPREPTKWDVLFAVSQGYGWRDEEDGLSAMVMVPQLDGASFVAMMVVDPAHQGRGLARQLLARVIAEADTPLMLYATERGRPVYDRLGFREVDRIRKHIGTPRGIGAPEGVRVATLAELEKLAAWDARAFGAGRTRLLGELVRKAVRVIVDSRGGFARDVEQNAQPLTYVQEPEPFDVPGKPIE